MKKWWLMALVVLCGGTAWADPPTATPSTMPTACACHMEQGFLMTYLGTLAPEGGHLVLHTVDGSTLTLLDSPGLEKVKLVPTGQSAQVTGLLKGSSLVVQTLSLEDNGEMHVVLTNQYPMRGRCQHCGCRMIIESANQTDAICTQCKCGKKCSECLK